jgi:AmpD protein
MAGLWHDGWYRFARHHPSPNFGARPSGACIDLIVVHSISLPPGVFGGTEVQQLFCNELDWNAHPYFKQMEGLQVSAHFYVRRNGELWQFVSCDQRAWHAGNSHYRGRDGCNDDSVGIELEGIEGGAFEPEQYETLGGVCAAIAGQYPIAHLAGHEHIAPGRKADPGAGFDWTLLRRSLGWAPAAFPQPTRP